MFLIEVLLQMIYPMLPKVELLQKQTCFENAAFKKKRMYQSNFTFKLERRKTIISFHIFTISNSTCL